MISNTRIAVIGLGYVGLPLARLFATKYPVVGFDINQSRINGLLSGTDSTGNFGRSIASSTFR
jgi:UDP-N-acetyl-D-galactosamine dehydrogenase